MENYNELLDYRVVISKWSAAFGADNLIPILYEKQIGVVEAFSRAIGLTPEPRYQRVPNPNSALARMS